MSFIKFEIEFTYVIFLNISFGAPHTGQVQFFGKSSKGVPEPIFWVGSPASGS